MGGSQQQAEPTFQTTEPPTKSFKVQRTELDTNLALLEEIKRVSRERAGGFHGNSLPVVEVPIPQTVIIDCPMVRPMARAAYHCKQCNDFRGIVQTSWCGLLPGEAPEKPPTPLAWSEKYAVRCGFALERKTKQVVIE